MNSNPAALVPLASRGRRIIHQIIAWLCRVYFAGVLEDHGSTRMDTKVQTTRYFEWFWDLHVSICQNSCLRNNSDSEPVSLILLESCISAFRETILTPRQQPSIHCNIISCFFSPRMPFEQLGALFFTFWNPFLHRRSTLGNYFGISGTPWVCL